MRFLVRPNLNGVFPRVINGPSQLALGNGTQYNILVYRTGGKLHLGVEGKGCYGFGLSVDASYVAEKFRLEQTMGDAANLADFINDQIAESARPRQGHYDAQNCEDWAAEGSPVRKNHIIDAITGHCRNCGLPESDTAPCKGAIPT
jgi:hypothetical protein